MAMTMVCEQIHACMLDEGASFSVAGRDANICVCALQLQAGQEQCIGTSVLHVKMVSGSAIQVTRKRNKPDQALATQWPYAVSELHHCKRNRAAEAYLCVACKDGVRVGRMYCLQALQG